MIWCGDCQSKVIPLSEGIHYCTECSQGHEIEKVNEHFIVHPYPREKEGSVKTDD